MPIKYKIFWLYITDKCTNAGIWNVNIRLASFQIGEELNKDDILKHFGDRIQVLDDEKWFIPKFIKFQYGHLSEHCKPHIPIIAELENYRVLKGYLNPLRKEKEKEEEKDKEKDLYLDSVLLTKIEHEKLIDKLGKAYTNNYIERLNNYAGQFPKKFAKYVSHYSTILNWYAKDEKETESKKKPEPVFRKGV